MVVRAMPELSEKAKIDHFFSKVMNKCCSLVRRKIFTASQGVVIKHFQEDETSAVIEVQRQSHIGRIIVRLKNPQKKSKKSIFKNFFRWVIFKNQFQMSQFLRIVFNESIFKKFLQRINFYIKNEKRKFD